MATDAKNCCIWISLAAAVILVASFMPWGTIRSGPSFGDLPPEVARAVSGMFSQPTVAATVDGWHGTFNIAGLRMPAWVVVPIALLVTTIAWLVATRTWQPPRFLAAGVAAIGLLIVVLLSAMLIVSDRGTFGAGLLFTGLGFATQIAASVRLALDPDATAAP